MKSLALIGLVAVSTSLLAAERPNLIVINVDDLGYADIGPFGSQDNPTPHLDRMAAEGRRLTSFYAAPVCSPSRASLMTGCYPKRTLPIPHVLFPAAAVGLNPEETTVADLLKSAGYATACIGKWHLGDQPEFLPTRQGFDYYFGIPYSNDMGTAEDGSKSNPGQPKPQRNRRTAPMDEYGMRGFNQPPLPLLENEQIIARVREREQFDVTRKYTEKAVEFIHEQKEGPFFLYLPHTAVHFPLYPHEDFQGKSQKGLIGDWAAEVDWSTGQILDAVRELQLAEKTLVLFTSDNGGARNHGSDNTPLRGSKGQTFEGGIRVCTIAWWPGRIPAGTSTDAITSMMDVLPTFAKLAGAAVPTNRKIDGVDIWPALIGDASPHEVFYYFRGAELQAVRQGPWKLHLNRGELYHLDDDISESSDVAAAHADVVARLRALAEEMRDDLGVDTFGPGCRPLGRVENPQPLINHDGTVRPGFAATQDRFP
jgi:arylsulfatase A